MVVKLAPSWAQRDNCSLAFICAIYKTDWAANEDAVEIQFAVLYTVDFVLIDKVRMNELNMVINM
jgi:hypothetical protein